MTVLEQEGLVPVPKNAILSNYSNGFRLLSEAPRSTTSPDCCAIVFSNLREMYPGRSETEVDETLGEEP